MYGTPLSSPELLRFLDHTLAVDRRAGAAGRRRYPVCIWGRHGIGKTQLVEEYARRAGWPLVYVAPAQFEEMGDLLGMPQVEEREGRRVTVFRPPHWAPAQEGPGILLLDDFNRADDRILRGLMQLLLDFRLLSWSLPPRWQIILTANPDDGEYSVTPLDDSLLTRLRHVTLRFEPEEWARWAEGAGIDERGIRFVLSYPEAVTGRRTTPRTLVQFFEAIEEIENLQAALPLVQALGEASLDAETVAAFIAFIRQGLDRLPRAEELLLTEHFEHQVAFPLERLTTGAVLRADILAALVTRLSHYLSAHGLPPGKRPVVNLQAFLRLGFLPGDLRLRLARELASLEDGRVGEVFEDEELGRLLVGG